MKQPVLGVAASTIIVLLSLVVVRLLGVDLFMGWASYALMGAIPFAIVVGAFWQGQEPRALAGLPQPARGLAYLAIAAVVAAVVAVVHWVTRGGGVTPPTPMAVMTIITSVVTTFLMAIMFGGWPFTLIRNRLLGGIALLVSAYVINAIIYQVFFNFSFASAAPWHSAALDPGGLFNAWDVVVVMVTTLVVMFAFLLLDLWPLSSVPALRKQPLLGVVWLVVSLVIGLALFWLGTAVAGLAAPTFMVRVPIPFIFGTILLLNMLGGSLLPKGAQPVKGLVGIVLAFLLGSVLALGYQALMPLLSAPLPAGSEGGFAAEVWLANALLAVTFPFLAFYGDFFGLWPLAGKQGAAADSAAR
nr:hypothetical protein [Propionibacterium sp.]